MGLRQKLSQLRQRLLGQRSPARAGQQRYWTPGGIEQLEPRRMLAADIWLGAVYFDPNEGLDSPGNTFHITWQGGAPGTQLTELVIETDKVGDGLTIGDTFFDTAGGLPGAFASTPYSTISSIGFTITSISVADGGTTLRLTFDGFDAGESLTFNVDVDEMGFLSANAVAEGNEFEGSKLTGTFVNPNYQTATGTDIFLDFFDPKLSPSGLTLPNDSYAPLGPASPIYTAGAVFSIQQNPLLNSIKGRVEADTDDDCFNGIGETPLSGVIIELLDSNGTVIGTTTTDVNGEYLFDNLVAGTYSVREQQPAGYLQGTSRVGSLGGTKVDSDNLSSITLVANNHGTQYDFCEKVPTSIHGRVDADTDGDCFNGIGETPLSGVVIELLDSNGTVIATAVTDANGNYSFNNLKPGTYGVHEVQPVGYLNGATKVGSSGGNHSGVDLVTQVSLTGGVPGVNYDFCENVPATITGYVFRDGPIVTALTSNANLNNVAAQLYQNTTGTRTADDTPIAGVTLQLRDASGTVLQTTTTDSNGYYSFSGLKAGTYSVVEAQPFGYYDGHDNAGTTGGQAAEPGDLIAAITVAGGQTSFENNFSELQVRPFIFIIPPEDPGPPPEPPLNTGPAPDPIYDTQLHFEAIAPNAAWLTGGEMSGYTWHLSVINAGRPRGDQVAQLTGNVIGPARWLNTDLEQALWSLTTNPEDETVTLDLLFGMPHGIPVTGDFNGDGKTDVGVFDRGEWFIDLNGNGVWDDDDLWAKLGYDEDLPITGDWDGDGKTDIGIYGRARPGDPRAIANEPGLPDPDNPKQNVHKNMPPREEIAPQGVRSMQLTSAGKARSDLIDHVFNYGAPGDHPLAGNWNGSGSDTIGIFRDGRWDIDIDGNGKWSEGDLSFIYGQSGDLPVIGDFDGDGVDEIGVFRQGTWHIDTNHNRTLDEGDTVLKFGGAGDRPVVGDWDSDGADNIGVFHGGAQPSVSNIQTGPKL